MFARILAAPRWRLNYLSVRSSAIEYGYPGAEESCSLATPVAFRFSPFFPFFILCLSPSFVLVLFFSARVSARPPSEESTGGETRLKYNKPRRRVTGDTAQLVAL